MERNNWKEFAWRRFVRVAPLYWLFTLLRLVLPYVVPAAAPHVPYPRWNVVASFLFLPAYNFRHEPYPVLPVGWTLSYEMLFYAIVAAAIAWRRPILRWCVGVLVCLAVAGIFLPHRWGALTYLADPIELEFLGGILIAGSLHRFQRLPKAIFLAAFPLAVLFAMHFGYGSHTALRPLVWGVPGALIVCCALALERHLNFHQPILLLLGDASYSIYLTHFFFTPASPLLARILHLHGHAGAVGLFIGVVLLCVVAGVAVHLWLELPLLRALNHYRPPWSVRSADDAWQEQKRS